MQIVCNSNFSVFRFLFTITTMSLLFVCVPIFCQKMDRYGLKVVKCVRVTEYPNYDDNPVWESVYTMEYDDTLGLKRLKVERDRNSRTGDLRLYHIYTRKGNIVERYSPDETPYGTLVEYHFNKDGVIGEKVESSERLGEDGIPIKGMVRSKRMETFEYAYVNHVSFPLLTGKELSFLCKDRNDKWYDEDKGEHQYTIFSYPNGGMVFKTLTKRKGQIIYRAKESDYYTNEYTPYENDLNIDIYPLFNDVTSADPIYATEWCSMRSKYLIDKEYICGRYNFEYEFDEHGNLKHVNVDEMIPKQRRAYEVDIEYVY